jgi:hypothetical protein
MCFKFPSSISSKAVLQSLNVVNRDWDPHTVLLQIRDPVRFFSDRVHHHRVFFSLLYALSALRTHNMEEVYSLSPGLSFLTPERTEPFSLRWSPDEAFLAAGLGDGTV